VLDKENCAFRVLSFDSLSGVAGLADGFIVNCEICVLYIVSSLPIVILGEGDISSPLKLGRTSDKLAAAKFANGAASSLQAFIAGYKAC